ncbi:MAG: nitroreductase/quinone reductase family protein [Chloroflexi bacterium]|nr:nitroreductase/quinone reductase family protein [Chloroflexota bacterium]
MTEREPMSTYRGIRQAFRVLNHSFMISVFRSGLGAWVVSPWAGYIMVLTTIGHRTGRLRHTPVNYALIDGDVCCIAGFGSVVHWARNLAAVPEAEVQLPAGRFWGRVQTVTDDQERLRIGRQILKNAGFAGFFFGFSPFTTSDEQLGRGIAGVPVYRIRPSRAISAVFDPGAAGWIGSTLVWIVVLALVVAVLIH